MSSPVQNRRAISFKLDEPIITGYLQTQGSISKLFKKRFFVLYPGFLVSYTKDVKWQEDVQRGDTLGGRHDAVKLKGGSVDRAKNPPKGCHYGMVIESPDPYNSKREFLIECGSSEERYQWMKKIQSAIPRSKSHDNSSPSQNSTKMESKSEKKDREVEKNEPPVSSPIPTRQETVDEAAMLAVSGHHDVEDQALTDIDHVLGPQIDSLGNDSDSSSSNGGEEQNISQTTHYIVNDTTVVSSSSMDANTGSPSVSPSEMDTNAPDEASKDEPKSDEEKCVDNSGKVEEDKASVESTEVSVSPQDSPKLSINVINVDATSTSSSSEEDEASSPVHGVATAADEEQSNNDGTKSPSPEIDARRPTGIKAFTERTGFLYKMGGRHKSWKLRYFVLQPGMFSYYKKSPKEKPLGEVKLKNLQIMFPKPGEKKYSSFQFIVHTESQWNSRNDWVMAAQSEKEMNEWIDCFKLASGLKRLSSEASSKKDKVAQKN